MTGYIRSTQPSMEYIVSAAMKARPTCQSTIEAVMYEARTGGPVALLRGEGRERLWRCDKAARKQIEERLGKLWGERSAREVLQQATGKR